MDILLTGGTGYIGARVLSALTGAGHTVIAVVRSESSAETVRAAGAVARMGDLTDSDWVRTQLDEVDGAVHTAAGSDENDEAMNQAVVAAALEAYASDGKPFVLTGGVWTYGSKPDVTEASPSDPPAITAWRVPLEKRLLDSEVKASVVQPGIVYGHGAGIVTMLAGGPRDDDGRLVLIGDGEQHWSTIHVDDLADLYLAVLEHAPGGSAYIGAGGENPTVAELGRAAVGPDGDVVPGSAEEATERLGGAFAEALLLDQQATGAHARTLGWTPTRPSLVALLTDGAEGYTRG